MVQKSGTLGSSRPRAFHADGNGDDGGEVYANMTRVPPIPARALYKKDPTPTMVIQNANSDQRAQKLCGFTLSPDVPTPTVGTTKPVCYIADEATLPAPPIGTVRKRFMADTGANRSIHPNGRSATSFY